MNTTTHRMPPLKSLLKSSDVEDPINIYIHRTAAYGIVRALWNTPVTPNMITLMSVIAGLMSGAMFIYGTRGAMVAAGALLWSAAILDGADGILARAKNMQSQFGRALDGWADMMVAFFTVFPAFWHIWVKYESPQHLWMMVPAIAMTAVHLWLYDYYKESYLRMTRLDRGGEGEDIADVESRIEEGRRKGLLYYVAIKHVLLPYLQTQRKIINILNPLSQRQGVNLRRSEESAAIYRKYNIWPMRMWMLVSLAPHSYLMAWCAMADRLDVYLWVRLVGMNAIFLVGLVWQRWATRQTLTEFEAIGALDPHPDDMGCESFATDP